MTNHNINWSPILTEIAEYCENRFQTALVIDTDVLQEVELMAGITLDNFKITNPNVAKIASSIAFWIRKLKPIYFDENAQNKFLAINELVSLLVGLSICKRYFDDSSNTEFKISKRILNDWTSSYRINSHSPHSSTIAFELLASK
ncbi:MAG: hypothetical protein U9Q30_02260 [Campylobacterota bacterium]|nr:hypothetical protein [Campylobacterota bacterium]